MKRRSYLKRAALGSVLPLALRPDLTLLDSFLSQDDNEGEFRSDWHEWRDMKWVGPEFWANRLQDWYLRSGEVVCGTSSKNRNLHLLTVRHEDPSYDLHISVVIKILNHNFSSAGSGCIGLRVGAKGPFDDYRSAAVFGKGLDLGLTPDMNVLLGEEKWQTDLEKWPGEVFLSFSTKRSGQEGILVKLDIVDNDEGTRLFSRENLALSSDSIVGNIALLSHVVPGEDDPNNMPSASFSDLHIRSEGLVHLSENEYGPICFAQYTVHKRKLKLTAQLAPVEQIEGHNILFQLWEDNGWATRIETGINDSSRAVKFEIDNWNSDRSIPYRIVIELPMSTGSRIYAYEGSIAKEPVNSDEVRAALFSCNFHYGFPDSDIYEGVSKLDPDMIFFVGDQFYEGTGGFGVQYSGEFDEVCLDYLRKWMMFGWSYREIFRNRPCAIIPDDHDVYHGNVWGEGGNKADTSLGYGSAAQDTGGYKMPADFVNMVQFTQTSHLPDPWDPTPVKQGIGVYYTNWNYAGLSFAILEDRKFKSAPKNILPEEAEVWNGWIQNENFDVREHSDPEAELLGPRQETFLEDWVNDWSDYTQMKAVISQTNFATVATLPENAKSDAVVPSLPVPEKGEYVQGDRQTVDMDSNGWPSDKRDRALRILRKGFSFHMAGDQHLASFVQYGVDEFGDSGFAFAGPALNNIWPRRFWPPVDTSRHTYEDPAYVGDHLDGFGNKVSVKAVANPYRTHKEPAILHDRAVGYGLVTFNKRARTIRIGCYRRFHDPMKEGSQFIGWPLTITQEDNYGRVAEAYLPRLKFDSEELPVVSIYKEENGELVYSLRVKESGYQPAVFHKGKYRIRVHWELSGKVIQLENIKAGIKQKKVIHLDF